jgi:hypothetical protein
MILVSIRLVEVRALARPLAVPEIKRFADLSGSYALTLLFAGHYCAAGTEIQKYSYSAKADPY